VIVGNDAELPGDDGEDYGVQHDEGSTIESTKLSFFSQTIEDRRLELGGVAATSRAWTKSTREGGSGPRIPYQVNQNEEVGSVAQFASLMSSDAVEIARRSCAHGQ
jgi:hypothetical protein